MLWTKMLIKEDLPDCEPKEAYEKISACVSNPNPLCVTGKTAKHKSRYVYCRESLQLPALHFKEFKGNFPIWRWIPTALPCPNAVTFSLLGGRPIGSDNESVSNFNVTVEVQMFPPNVSLPYWKKDSSMKVIGSQSESQDAVNKPHVPFTRTAKIKDIFPVASRDYIFILGSFHVRHKCRLLVRMRSEARPEDILGHFVFSGFKLDGSKPDFLSAGKTSTLPKRS
ncbi:hypothetical protein K469DRAFT_365818 [Zopfia rhizophila CBS 207.26]|uniref:Uncharacterized protein n=1 Tax=Zopfia rhizophila CBS 207.26 TaxID=1314779 RepID=A0A6A6EIB7_9PEZI|nr:hypothetical protein K469DRAFT_365818 [Zopfia rhizophila CBS 207.26]